MVNANYPSQIPEFYPIHYLTLEKHGEILVSIMDYAKYKIGDKFPYSWKTWEKNNLSKGNSISWFQILQKKIKG